MYTRNWWTVAKNLAASHLHVRWWVGKRKRLYTSWCSVRSFPVLVVVLYPYASLTFTAYNSPIAPRRAPGVTIYSKPVRSKLYTLRVCWNFRRDAPTMTGSARNRSCFGSFRLPPLGSSTGHSEAAITRIRFILSIYRVQKTPHSLISH